MASFKIKMLFIILSSITLVYICKSFSACLPKPYPDEYNVLIDVPFNFLRIPPCGRTNKFIVLVNTAVGNKAERDVIRGTWAAKNKTNADIFFLVGKSGNATENKNINDEINEYGNFVQGDFLDSYNNLTYKHIMGLKYVFYHCPKIEYVIKIDDDTLVNVPVLKSFLNMYTKQNGHTKDILCSKIIHNRNANREISTKNYHNSSYPSHCLGYAIIYPKTAVELLYPVAQTLRNIWTDDVYVTGIVAREAGIQQVNIDTLILNPYELETIKFPEYDLNMRPVLFGPPQMSSKDIKTLSEYLWTFGRKSSILEYLED